VDTSNAGGASAHSESLVQPDRDALRIELQEGVATFRHITTLIMQMLEIVVAADVILVSYGISQRTSAVLLVASSLPIIMFIGMMILFNHAFPIILTVMWIEEQLSLGERSLATTYARVRLSPFYENLRHMVSAGEQRVPFSFKAFFKIRPLYIISCVFVIQFGLFIIGLTIYHYRFM
jgi:hypothetical protein